MESIKVIKIKMLSNLSSKLIGFLLFLAIALVILTSVVRFAFRILYGIFPLLLLATIFINRSVFKEYGSKIQSLWKDNWIIGAGAVVLSLLFIPLVALYLFVKALKSKEETPKEKNEEWIPYEEIVEEPSKSERNYF